MCDSRNWIIDSVIPGDAKGLDEPHRSVGSFFEFTCIIGVSEALKGSFAVS